MKALERKLAVAVKRAEAVEKRARVATGRTKVVHTPASTDNHGDHNHDDVAMGATDKVEADALSPRCVRSAAACTASG